MNREENNYDDSDRLSEDTEYQGAATGRDEPDIFHDDDIVEIALKMAPESESSDFSNFTEEEKKKEFTEGQDNQGNPWDQDSEEEESVIGDEQTENNSNWMHHEDSEHEPPNEA